MRHPNSEVNLVKPWFGAFRIPTWITTERTKRAYSRSLQRRRQFPGVIYILDRLMTTEGMTSALGLTEITSKSPFELLWLEAVITSEPFTFPRQPKLILKVSGGLVTWLPIHFLRRPIVVNTLANKWECRQRAGRDFCVPGRLCGS